MMAPSVVRHKSPMKQQQQQQQQRGGSPDLDSPPRRRSSPPRRERSPPARRRTSPRTTTNSSHRARSPATARDNEKPSSSRGRSSKSERSSSPPTSQSPSPRTKRLRRAQGEREVVDREPPLTKRNSNREGDKEQRYREKGGGHRDDDEHNERRWSARESNDGGSGSSRSRHRRSISPMDRGGHKNRHSSHSPHRSSRSRAHEEEEEEEVEVPNPRGADHHGDGDDDSVAKMKAAEEALEAKKQKPSFELSGKLADETNRVKGVTLLFTEPPEARKPDVRWRLYVFKAGEVLNEPLYIHRQSCYLFGRERRVADVPTDHPSCSKQHAVIQFRQVEKERPDGMLRKLVGPYLMDLGSTNGTFINDNRVEPQRYYELFEKDTIKFGNSSREYVILHENSGGE